MSSETHQAQKCKNWTFPPPLKAKNCQAGCRVLTEVRKGIGKNKRLDVIVSNTNLNQHIYVCVCMYIYIYVCVNKNENNETECYIKKQHTKKKKKTTVWARRNKSSCQRLHSLCGCDMNMF